MVLLDDVSYGEYYPYGDSACVILHAPYCQMEVPLWPFGERGRDVIDFLTGRGIRVVDVQSDEQIPETLPRATVWYYRKRSSRLVCVERC